MPRYMNKSIPYEWKILAFNQAACIHQDEDAHKIAGEAICRLNVTSTQQRKRLFANTKQPARIYLDDMHLLQHLVFLQSEKYERAQENYAPDSINEKDMIIRYLAFIVRKILKRNSLYGVTGVCRFICNYELKHVREIHGALIDDPDRYKTDDDFRINRNRMRDMIFERFSKHLRMEVNQTGQEKHFQLRDNQNDLLLLRLIKKYLDSFKPWCTGCLPTDFKPHKEKPVAFRHQDEHANEIMRLHTLIHLECLRTLTDALGFDTPDARLGIPSFFLVKPFDDNDDGNSSPSSGSGGNDGNSPPSRQRELQAFRNMLTEQDEKLDRFSPEGLLIVKIDNKDVAKINLDTTNRAQFIIDNENAELIEIVAQNDQLVLAVHLLDEEVWQSQNRKYSYVVHHKNGAEITFILRRLTSTASGNNQLSVTVTYRETQLIRSLVFLWRRLRNIFLSWRTGKADLAILLLPLKMSESSPLRLLPLLTISIAVGLLLFGLLSSYRSPLTNEVDPVQESNSNTVVPGNIKPQSDESNREAQPPEIPVKVGRTSNNRRPASSLHSMAGTKLGLVSDRSNTTESDSRDESDFAGPRIWWDYSQSSEANIGLRISDESVREGRPPEMSDVHFFVLPRMKSNDRTPAGPLHSRAEAKVGLISAKSTTTEIISRFVAHHSACLRNP